MINSVAKGNLNVEANKADRRAFRYIKLKNKKFVRIIHKIRGSVNTLIEVEDITLR